MCVYRIIDVRKENLFTTVTILTQFLYNVANIYSVGTYLIIIGKFTLEVFTTNCVSEWTGTYK